MNLFKWIINNIKFFIGAIIGLIAEIIVITIEISKLMESNENIKEKTVKDGFKSTFDGGQEIKDLIQEAVKATQNSSK